MYSSTRAVSASALTSSSFHTQLHSHSFSRHSQTNPVQMDMEIT